MKKADITFWLVLIVLLVGAGIITKTLPNRETEQRVQKILFQATQDLNAKRIKQAEKGFREAISLTKYKTNAYLSAIGASLKVSRKVGNNAKNLAGAFAIELLDLNDKGKLDKKLKTRELHFLGGMLGEIGRYKESIKVLEQIVAKNPNNAIYANSLGYIYAESDQRLDRALELTKRAVSMSPNEPMFIDSLGWVYFKLGRYDEAIYELERAVKGSPNQSEIRYHLAAAYERVGKMTEAYMELQKSLVLDPNNAQARALYRQMKQNKKPQTRNM